MTATARLRISIGIAAGSLFMLSFTNAARAGTRVHQRLLSAAAWLFAGGGDRGGKTVWLAGQIATVDDSGKSLAGDFEGQVRQIFKLLDATLKRAGGKLSDMVQMTVFITDVRNGDRLTEIRREIFGDNFPGSALITITALADPNAKIEIQGSPSSGASRFASTCHGRHE